MSERLREILKEQPVLPAPMCGISDYAQRELCRRMGARVTYTQMISSEGMVRGGKFDMRVLNLHAPENHLAIQVFGADPGRLADSVARLEEAGATIIDLNMGCPARKITCSQSGSALLRNLPLVKEIFKAMRAATGAILTAKMRWSFGDGEEGAALEVARIAEGEGLEGIALHARTRAQGYSGKANWEQIAQMKAATSLPVIGNGDIRTPADALAMREHTGCEGVMIGRALIGDPWLLGECLEALRTGKAPAERHAPDWPERRRVMLEHARLMYEAKGDYGVVEFRKHASAYLRGLPGAKKLRAELVRMSRLEDVEAVLLEDLNELRELTQGTRS